MSSAAAGALTAGPAQRVVPVALKKIAPIAIWLLAWEALVKSGVLQEEFLPSAESVASALLDLVATADFWTNLHASFVRATIGFGTGSALGVVLAFAMATSRVASRAIWPLVTITYSLPKTSLVPLFLLWFGIGDVTSILAVLLSCLLPVVVTTFHGLRGGGGRHDRTHIDNAFRHLDGTRAPSLVSPEEG